MVTEKLLSNVVICFCFILLICPLSIYSQSGNTISGHVFGLQRQPVSEATVELLDDYSRSVARTRTNGSGYYSFSRVPSGRFRIRVLPYGVNYQEQEQDIEIVNFSRETAGGGIRTSGFENAQRDFYLRLRKDNQITVSADAFFVQEVPEQARETYKKAIYLLDIQKQQEGLKELKSSIEIFPNYYEAIERLGNEYIKLGYYEAAQILLRRAVEINSRGYKSWYGLAYALYSLNKTNEAIESIQKAISLNQFSVDAYLLDGVLHKKTKDYKEAEKQLKKAKDLAKGSVPEVHWQLALLYGNNLNRYREAATELELLLKALPNHANAENIRKLIKLFREKA